MSENIEGKPYVSPEDKALFKQDYARGVKLFQNSLIEYENTTEEHKKAKFKQVMDEASTVMNETAKLCLSKKGQKLEKTLEQDYKEFNINTSDEVIEKLRTDITEIQKKL